MSEFFKRYDEYKADKRRYAIVVNGALLISNTSEYGIMSRLQAESKIDSVRLHRPGAEIVLWDEFTAGVFTPRDIFSK